MLGQIGIMALISMGLYGFSKYTGTDKYKVRKLWEQTLLSYPSQTSIRNAKGFTFSIYDIVVKGGNISGRLHIPLGLGDKDFDKVIPALERAFYGKLEVTSEYYITIESGRK